jgi:hypothetical protein
MSENEETKWRLSTVSEQRDIVHHHTNRRAGKKGEITRKSIQTKAEDIGSGRDGSLVTKTEEVHITELNLENNREIQGRNFKSSDTT